MILNKIGLKKIWLIFLAIVSLFLLQNDSSNAGTIVVKPGRFDYFALQVPDKIIAGENFIVKAYVYDANNNLITNFSEYGKEFKVEISGSATVQSSVLSGASFSGGVANILINDKKAEKVTFSIKESGGTVPVISRELSVIPNKLDHFVLYSPDSVIAGSTFVVKVMAKDMFDNTVNDNEVGRNIKMTSTGTASVKNVGSPALDFANGTGNASFVSEKAGVVAIELQEVSTGSSGTTQSIRINPASLSSFKVQVPRNVIAGEPFDLLIAAYDSYGNIVTNYPSVGGGVRLSTTGTSKIEPSFINPNELKSGQTVIKAVYEKAEDIQVIAKENNREQEGRTDSLLVANSAPDHFVVITPDTALSGQGFTVKVEAYDRYNNIVTNYNLTGNDVGLSTSGSGTLSPARISPADFRSGVAMVQVLYDKAESFLISARMFGEKPSGRVTMKEQKVSKEISQNEKKVKAPKESQSAQAVKASPKKKKEAPKEDVKEEKKTKTEPKKAPLKKEEPVQVAKKEVPEARPVEKKSVEAKEVKKSVQESVKPSGKTGPATEKKPVEAKTEKRPDVALSKPPAAAAPVKDNRPGELYQVSKLSIIEVKDKVMVVVNITNPNGHLEYTDEIESKYGKEWLRINLKPAVNKTEKLFKFNSSFVGEVRIEEDKTAKNNIFMYIELLPAGVTYDVARVKNNLIITIANP